MMKSGGYRPLVVCVPPTKPVPCPVLRLEDLGFEVGMFSLDQVDVGAWRTRSRPPDLIGLAGQAYRICGAGNLALLLDAHRSYALNVRRTVEELETAGIRAMSIEDTVLPRPYGHNGKSSLSSIEEGVGAMRARAVGVPRQEPRHRGRTSVLAIANLDEAVKRAKAYEAVGFDAIFLAAGVTVEAAHVGSGSPYRPKPRSRPRCRRFTTR
jgi:carboxyvinyl-carboxyphosphonate phosphorylmutase